MTAIKSTYSSFEKASNAESNVGKVLSFRVCESKPNYYIAKTIDEKKPKVAILPKCLVSSFDIVMPLDQANFSFEAIVLEINEGLPVIAFKPELIELKDEMTLVETDS